MTDNLSLLQPDNAFCADRRQDALRQARRNALRRLVRCLFAENIIARDALLFSPLRDCAWLPIWNRHAILYFDDVMAAPANTVVIGGTITLIESGGSRVAIDTPAQLIDVLMDQFDFVPGEEGMAALKDDIGNSVENDALARIYRQVWNSDLRILAESRGASSFIAYLRQLPSLRDAAVLLDQWGALEGHPFYPTWKSKPDLSPQEVARLSPEFNARVTVCIAALRADMAYIERMPHVDRYPQWFAKEFPDCWAQWQAGLHARGLNEKAWLPLPVHSWHLEHYVRQTYADEIAEGILIPDGPEIETLATMSFRTMAPLLPTAPFIKLPVALWLTSEQRSLQAKSIHMGPRISALIQRILLDENGFDGMLDIFPEEVGLHYRHAVKQEDRSGRHLSVVYRGTRTAFDRDDGLLPVTVAALFASSPISNRPLVTELIEQEGRIATEAQVVSWFRQYAAVVARPVLGIYLLYGIGLEAHQQNTSVLFGADGLARSLLIRDFGDGRTYAPRLESRGHQLEPYIHPGILPTVFRDDVEPVRSFVIDACFVCHLHELALLLTKEYRLRLPLLWDVLREVTEAAFEAVATRTDKHMWQQERDAFLQAPWSTRSVLRMHLLRYADYRLQHALSNPLVPTGLSASSQGRA